MKCWVLKHDSYGNVSDEVKFCGEYLGAVFAPGGVAIGVINEATGIADFVSLRQVTFKEPPKKQETKNERTESNGPKPVHGGPSQPTSGNIDGSSGPNDRADASNMGQVRDTEKSSVGSVQGVRKTGSGRNQYTKGNK